MGKTNSISAREIKLLLTVDSDFKYDNIEKGKKLYDYLLRNPAIKSQVGLKFRKKFGDYCDMGIVPAMCPSCGKFAEGKGRILCFDCVDKFSALIKRVEEARGISTPKQTKAPVQRMPEVAVEKTETIWNPITTDNVENKKRGVSYSAENDLIIAQAEQLMNEKNKQEIKSVDSGIDSKEYVIIPRRRFYIGVASAVVAALFVNILIALPYIHKDAPTNDNNIAIIYNEDVPTSGR